jgi:hypothetical protein
MYLCNRIMFLKWNRIFLTIISLTMTDYSNCIRFEAIVSIELSSSLSDYNLFKTLNFYHNRYIETGTLDVFSASTISQNSVNTWLVCLFGRFYFTSTMYMYTRIRIFFSGQMTWHLSLSQIVIKVYKRHKLLPLVGNYVI